ncbi:MULTISPECIES: alcohol dehydrogenase [Rhizobium/Agrobacterium group]|uniref:alcohol dehydrogenase n=1 Tax=Rhizobium/Agrobacterium group TaxID=227290 RepID=UPI000713677B|nr:MULTISPECIES: alcohol dehydrogenase [Rhizobium/Agrobacterium group]KRA64320.1 alcohol dehydrogenase [Rhizobium sp. Root651]MDH1270411.1 alcohol dehydrogenase [Agrobacterium pusense]
MRCQCVHEFGRPLRADDRPDLIPRGSEVVLSVTAAGVCHTDLHIRDGGYDLGHGRKLEFAKRGIELPRVMGHEIVGEVVATGPDVGMLDRGKKYVVYPWIGCGTCATCVSGQEQLCMTPKFLGMHVDGGYATQIRVPHPKYLYEIGDIPPENAAPLACSGLTAYGALKKVEGTLKDHAILVIGAGGLGLMCAQLLRALGAKAPVFVDIDPVKRASAVAAGACAAVDPRAPDAVAQIHAAAGEAPLAAIDFVGAEATAELGFNALGKGGTYVIVGLFGGAAPWALPLIAVRSLTIRGSYTGSPGEFAELMRLARNGAINPIPTTCYKLDEAENVLNNLAGGKIVGRAILASV